MNTCFVPHLAARGVTSVVQFLSSMEIQAEEINEVENFGVSIRFFFDHKWQDTIVAWMTVYDMSYCIKAPNGKLLKSTL